MVLILAYNCLSIIKLRKQVCVSERDMVLKQFSPQVFYFTLETSRIAKKYISKNIFLLNAAVSRIKSDNINRMITIAGDFYLVFSKWDVGIVKQLKTSTSDYFKHLSLYFEFLL